MHQQKPPTPGAQPAPPESPPAFPPTSLPPSIFGLQWVARDLNGKRLLKVAPYVSDLPSIVRLSKGLPAGLKCCWNGLVVLKAGEWGDRCEVGGRGGGRGMAGGRGGGGIHCAAAPSHPAEPALLSLPPPSCSALCAARRVVPLRQP